MAALLLTWMSLKIIRYRSCLAQRNLAVELLEKLLKYEVKARMKTDLMLEQAEVLGDSWHS
jgi:hypothetical protein